MGQLYSWCKGELNAVRVSPCVAHGGYTDRVVAAHHRYRNDGDYSEYIGPLVIDTPRTIVPLQAADLLAYEFYHWWIDTECSGDAGLTKQRPVLDRAIERNVSAMRGACYSGNGLQLAVARHAERARKRKGDGDGEG